MIKRLKTKEYLNSQGGPWSKVSDNKANNISEDQMPVHSSYTNKNNNS